MRDFFLTLLITSLIGGIICALSDTKFEKPIKYLVSLICIVLILSPISSVFSGGDSFEVSLPEVSVDEEFIGDWIMTETENMLKKSVSEAVFSKFGFYPKKIELSLTSREGENGSVTVVEKVSIYILAENSAHKEELCRYLDALLYTNSEVLIHNE